MIRCKCEGYIQQMLYILQYSSSEKKIFCVPFFKFLQHAKSLFCYYIHLKHTKRLLCNYIHLKQQQIIRPEFDRVRLSCTNLRNGDSQKSLCFLGYLPVKISHTFCSPFFFPVMQNNTWKIIHAKFFRISMTSFMNNSFLSCMTSLCHV